MNNKDFSKYFFNIILIILGAIILETSTNATTVVMMNDEDLTVSSRAIIRGRVTRIESQFDENQNRIYTYITVRVKSVYKGQVGSREVVIRQLGGRVGEKMQMIYGAPQFKLDENVLLFLNTADDGALRVAHLFMGKYSIKSNPRLGTEFVERLTGKVEILDPANFEYGNTTNEMEISQFERKLKGILATRKDRVAKFEKINKNRPMLAIPREYNIKNDRGSILPQFGLFEDGQGTGYRWFEADEGTPVTYHLNTYSSPVAGGGLAELTSALNAWTNIAESTVALQSGEPTTNCGFFNDGVTSVSFGDCADQIESPVGCSGVLAIGGISAVYNETKTVNGKSFYRIAEGDVVFNSGFECFLSNSSNLAEVMTHEIGHSVGISHSSENSAESNTTLKEATMFFQAHGDGRGANVLADDIAAAAFLYPAPKSVISSLSPTSGIAGDTITIKGSNLLNPTSVKLGTLSATVLSSSEDQIVATVPASAITGNITVTTSLGTISAGTFTVIKTPTISTFLTSGIVGTALVINGTNLNFTTGVKFNGISVTAPITVISATSIRVVVPAGATTGKISVTNRAGTAVSVPVFKVLPKVTGFTPGSGIVGETFKIVGTTLARPTAVRIGFVSVVVLSSSDTEITVRIPTTATTAKITVVTASGTSTSATAFTVIKAPKISSITTSGRVGSTVTINGTNLNVFITDVQFNGTSITSPVTIVTPGSSIKVVVPVGATTGKIKVTNRAGSATSLATFTVIR